MINVAIGDRMKRYEASTGVLLIPHLPTIIRIDGKSFHSYTKKIKATRPYDELLHFKMVKTMNYLVDNIQNAKLGVCHSDEISILMCDFPNLNTEQWFNGKVQKIVSVSASFATACFNKVSTYEPLAHFDSRVFQLPINEVQNYFVWRQQDAVRNSINMLAQSLYSHKELQGINCNALQEKMLVEKDVNWNNLEVWKKRGSLVIKNASDSEIPIFSQTLDFIRDFLNYEYK